MISTVRKYKLYFVVPYPLHTAPGQRFRFEQYIPVLENNGFEIHVHPFLSESTNGVFLQKGFYARKFLSIVFGLCKRAMLLIPIASADCVFIYREAAPLGPPIFEWIIIHLLRIKIIYDFDDAIWLTDRKNESAVLRIIKFRTKVAYLCRKSSKVICGNEFLANYAKQFSSQVLIVPTTINTLEYLPIERPHSQPVIIGWSGSVTTIEHFRFAIPALIELKKKYGNGIDFLVIGNKAFRNHELQITGLPWIKETELDDLGKMDIGIMPLPDEEWTYGKCGLKGLQYMALGIPTVISPIGVNTKIIQDGVNGFLASSTIEWIEKISRLIESYELRIQIGKVGRQTVENNYSLKSQEETYHNLFKSLCQ